MHIHRPAGVALFLLGAAALSGADANLDASIAKHRMGTLTIKTHPGAKVSVEQLRHEFWFGATLPGSMFSGKASAEDLAKFNEIFTTHFNAGVIEAAFKWRDMEREKGIVNYSLVDAMLAWADKHGIPVWSKNPSGRSPCHDGDSV